MESTGEEAKYLPFQKVSQCSNVKMSADSLNELFKDSVNDPFYSMVCINSN